MDIKVNENRILGQLHGYNNLDEIIEKLCFQEHEKGNVITKIIVNGSDWTSKDHSYLQTINLIEVSSLEIKSENPFQMACDCYRIAIDLQAILQRELNKIVEYSLGDFLSGAYVIGDSFFENLQLFINLLAKPAELLSLELDVMEFQGVKISELQENLFNKIQEMEDQHTILEAPNFAKWLSDQFNPILGQWEYVLRYLIHELEKLNNLQSPVK